MEEITRALVIGDLHCKMSLVLPRVTDVALAHSCDGIVLLGDLCDDWHVGGVVLIRQLECAAAWRKKAEDLGLKVTVLLGNHDSSYVGMYRYDFTRWRVRKEAGELLRKGLDVRVATTVQGMLLTHAGLTNSWAEANEVPPGFNAVQASMLLNGMFGDPIYFYRLAACGKGRGGDETPGPLWADWKELIDDSYPGISQIVGHTPLDTALGVRTQAGDTIWFADTMSLRPNGAPIGDATALVVGPEGVEPVPLFEDWRGAVTDFCAS